MSGKIGYDYPLVVSWLHHPVLYQEDPQLVYDQEKQLPAARSE